MLPPCKKKTSVHLKYAYNWKLHAGTKTPLLCFSLHSVFMRRISLLKKHISHKPLRNILNHLKCEGVLPVTRETAQNTPSIEVKNLRQHHETEIDLTSVIMSLYYSVEKYIYYVYLHFKDKYVQDFLSISKRQILAMHLHTVQK